MVPALPYHTDGRAKRLRGEVLRAGRDGRRTRWRPSTARERQGHPGGRPPLAPPNRRVGRIGSAKRVTRAWTAPKRGWALAAFDDLVYGGSLQLAEGRWLRMDRYVERHASSRAVATHAHDRSRRGRGRSRTTAPAALQRKIEHVDALIALAGGSAGLCGIASGGALALEAAITLGPRVTKLAVYEVPHDSSRAGMTPWAEYRAQLKRFDRRR